MVVLVRSMLCDPSESPGDVARGPCPARYRTAMRFVSRQPARVNVLILFEIHCYMLSDARVAVTQTRATTVVVYLARAPVVSPGLLRQLKPSCEGDTHEALNRAQDTSPGCRAKLKPWVMDA